LARLYKNKTQRQKSPPASVGVSYSFVIPPRLFVNSYKPQQTVRIERLPTNRDTNRYQLIGADRKPMTIPTIRPMKFFYTLNACLIISFTSSVKGAMTEASKRMAIIRVPSRFSSRHWRRLSPPLHQRIHFACRIEFEVTDYFICR